MDKEIYIECGRRIHIVRYEKINYRKSFFYKKSIIKDLFYIFAETKS